MISRTTTGNSSIISSTSTSSQNSSSTNSKRGWHIGSWFLNQQQQQQQQQLDHENLKNSIRRPDSGSDIATLSPQVTGGSKRQKVIQELMETEKTYQKDMILLKEIYFDQANTCLTKSNVRHLFSNLLEIVDFEKSFVTLLEHSFEQDSIGTAFRETVRSSCQTTTTEKLIIL
jgi:archaellum biogenesis ATPase FlaH